MRFGFFMLTFFMAAGAQAADLSFSGTAENPILTLNTLESIAHSLQGADLWLAVNDNTLTLTTAQEKLAGFGITQVEPLSTNRGTGMRISFAKPLSLHAAQKKNQWVFSTTLAENASEKGGIVALSDRLILSGKQNKTPVFSVVSSQLSRTFVLAGSVAVAVAQKAPLQPTIVGNNTVYKLPPAGKSIAVAGHKQGVEPLAKTEQGAQKSISAALEPRRETFKRTLRSVEEALSETQNVKVTTHAAIAPLESIPVEKEEISSTPVPLETVSDLQSETHTEPVAVAVASVPAVSPSVPVASDAFLTILSAAQQNNFTQTEHQLLAAVVQSPAEQRDAARLNLAKAYFAVGRVEEAQGVLLNLSQTAASQSLPVSDHARILLGASLVMQGKTEAALEVLTPAAAPNDHRELWLAAAHEAEGKTAEALPLFAKTIELARAYPSLYASQLWLAQARAQLAQGKHSDLQDSVRELGKLNPQVGVPDEARLILARSALLQGDTSKGEFMLADAAQSKDPRVANPAKYDFVKLLHSRKELTPAQTLQHLEDLYTLWRGDQMEPKILLDLGQLYYSQSDYRRALDRLKILTSYFPDSAQSLEGAKLMSDAFVKAFAQAQKLDMDTLGIVGMYYDFRELTPVGKEGDDILYDIGRRLQSLGLYASAADLYEHMITMRIRDLTAHAELGLMLAKMQRLKGDPNRALISLRNTVRDKAPEVIRTARLVEEIKIMMDLERFPEAKNAINKLPVGQTRTDLLADLAWKQNDFSTTAELLAPPFAVSTTALTPERQLQVEKLAYVQASRGNDGEIYPLAARTHAAVKEDGARVNRLNVLVALAGSGEKELLPDGKPSEPYNTAARQIAATNDFARNYLAELEKRRLEKEGRMHFNAITNPDDAELLAPPEVF